jgi:hypothetical protein
MLFNSLIFVLATLGAVSSRQDPLTNKLGTAEQAAIPTAAAAAAELSWKSKWQ